MHIKKTNEKLKQLEGQASRLELERKEITGQQKCRLQSILDLGQEINSLKSELENMDPLENKYQTKYRKLKNEYRKLKERYESLKKAFLANQSSSTTTSQSSGSSSSRSSRSSSLSSLNDEATGRKQRESTDCSSNSTVKQDAPQSKPDAERMASSKSVDKIDPPLTTTVKKVSCDDDDSSDPSGPPSKEAQVHGVRTEPHARSHHSPSICRGSRTSSPRSHVKRPTQRRETSPDDFGFDMEDEVSAATKKKRPRVTESPDSDRNNFQERNKEVRKSKERQVEAPCDVCCKTDSHPSNRFVVCNDCGTKVHQRCYGVENEIDSKWLCEPCTILDRALVEPLRCILCLQSGGALLPLARHPESAEIQWAHRKCSMWLPEMVTAKDPSNKRPVIAVKSSLEPRKKLKCLLCEKAGGAPVRCHIKSCDQSFHVTCAYKSKLELRERVFNLGTNARFRRVRIGYCPSHAYLSDVKRKGCQINVLCTSKTTPIRSSILAPIR